MVTNCLLGMSEWSRTTIIELINSTGRLTSSGLSNWFHLFTIVNINYTNSIIVKIFSVNTTNNIMFTSNDRRSSLSTAAPTRQMIFIWMYLDCWRKTFLANCRNSMMNSSFDDKQITNIDWWTMTCRHRTLLFFFFYIQITPYRQQLSMTIIDRRRRRETEKERREQRGTLVASHRSQ
jgi:hypothetical protein